MKNRILCRLILYFMATFVVFALIIGMMFAVLFSRHNMYIHHAELERQAVNIANTLSEFMGENTRRGMGHGMGNLVTFLQHAENISMNDVWVVDRDANQIIFGHGRHRTQMQFQDLPEGSEQIIAKAFDGAVAFDDSFSLFWDMPTITVAAPIILPNETIAGVVLLHSQVYNINQTTGSGLTLLLYSMAVAVLASIIVAVLLSSHFTKPLSKMKTAALRISDGDFSVKTDVNQKDEIGELASVFDDMVDKIAVILDEREKLDRLRKDFIANISHELRTPITVMRGSLEAILDGVVSEKDKTDEYLKEMFNECKHLERLVSDLLDLFKLQNSDFAMDAQMINLKDVAEDVANTMTKIAHQKEIALMLISNDTDFAFSGDYGRLRQMLIIAVDNAIKFSPKNSNVEIHLRKDNKDVCISICDRGSGLHPDDIAYIFERFYKRHSEQNKTGAGLGLAIAKQIADQHGVTINVANRSNGGAEFTFVFHKNF